jgi:hypothetical protein
MDAKSHIQFGGIKPFGFEFRAYLFHFDSAFKGELCQDCRVVVNGVGDASDSNVAIANGSKFEYV